MTEPSNFTGGDAATEKGLVGGVEACFWSEFIDATNFISRTIVNVFVASDATTCSTAAEVVVVWVQARGRARWPWASVAGARRRHATPTTPWLASTSGAARVSQHGGLWALRHRSQWVPGMCCADGLPAANSHHSRHQRGADWDLLRQRPARGRAVAPAVVRVPGAGV